MSLIKVKPLAFSFSVFMALTLSACGGGGASVPSINDLEIVDLGENTPVTISTTDSTVTTNTTDTTEPVITLKGASTVEVIQGANYFESGVTATDNVDGDISHLIVVGGEQVNSNAAAGTTFTLTYNISDAAGNAAGEVTRSVSVITMPEGNFIPEILAATIQEYLTVINNARTSARFCSGVSYPAVPAVTWSDKLYKAAYEHSQDLTESNTFAHAGSGTSSDWSGYALNQQSSMAHRVATYGYSWLSVSENIAAGTVRDTPQEAVDAWLASTTGHCENIMNGKMTEVGMALSSKQGTTYTHYWTQNFGKPQ